MLQSLQRVRQHCLFRESKAQILIAKELVDIFHNVDQRLFASGQLMLIVERGKNDIAKAKRFVAQLLQVQFLNVYFHPLLVLRTER